MRSWVARDFQEGAGGSGIRIVADLGLGLPVLGQEPVGWWAPAEHAARVRRAGIHVPLISPGPQWLSMLPPEYLGRSVWSGMLRDIAQAPRTGWAKPAEAKVEKLAAAWWDDVGAFARAATAAGLPGDSWVQVADTRLELVVEHRFFVTHAQVRTGSPYLVHPETTWFPGMEEDTTLHPVEARAFAQQVVSDTALQPPSYVLDVGLCANGSWVVIEANPAWCSAAYGADMQEVLWANIQAVDRPGAHTQWHWVPDAYLQARAERQRVLR